MPTSLFDLFQKGGLVMWPILLCSIAALTIAIERMLTLSRIESDSSNLLAGVTKRLEDRELAQAERLCDQTPTTPLARMVKSGIQKYGRPRNEIRETLEETGASGVPLLEQHLPILGTIAHMTPLLGLLGTVLGLVRCFQVIQEKATTTYPVNPGDLAGGIWEALLTTVFGLFVAIPAYAMYNYLVYRVNHLVVQMETSAIQLVDLLSGQPVVKSETQKPPHALKT